MPAYLIIIDVTCCHFHSLVVGSLSVFQYVHKCSFSDVCNLSRYLFQFFIDCESGIALNYFIHIILVN